jgi:hypothetical protein
VVIPKALEFRNENSRDKARLLFTAAMLGVDFGLDLFSPASLRDEVSVPAGKRTGDRMKLIRGQTRAVRIRSRWHPPG